MFHSPVLLTNRLSSSFRLRALLENMQMELQMANARLYDEIQNQPMHVSSPKWVRIDNKKCII